MVVSEDEAAAVSKEMPTFLSSISITVNGIQYEGEFWKIVSATIIVLYHCNTWTDFFFFFYQQLLIYEYSSY